MSRQASCRKGTAGWKKFCEHKSECAQAVKRVLSMVYTGLTVRLCARRDSQAGLPKGTRRPRQRGIPNGSVLTVEEARSDQLGAVWRKRSCVVSQSRISRISFVRSRAGGKWCAHTEWGESPTRCPPFVASQLIQ